MDGLTTTEIYQDYEPTVANTVYQAERIKGRKIGLIYRCADQKIWTDGQKLLEIYSDTQ